MYANEVLFVDKFLSKLKMMNVVSIPFRTSEYRAGIHAMKQYYEDNAENLDESVSDIRLLFLNNGQKDFADAIMAVNGNKISLQNPRLEKASIIMPLKRAQFSLADNMLNIPDDFITEITQAFCHAAGVPLENE